MIKTLFELNYLFLDCFSKFFKIACVIPKNKIIMLPHFVNYPLTYRKCVCIWLYVSHKEYNKTNRPQTIRRYKTLFLMVNRSVDGPFGGRCEPESRAEL